jgi:hypothetical protein
VKTQSTQIWQRIFRQVEPISRIARRSNRLLAALRGGDVSVSHSLRGSVAGRGCVAGGREYPQLVRFTRAASNSVGDSESVKLTSTFLGAQARIRTTRIDVSRHRRLVKHLHRTRSRSGNATLNAATSSTSLSCPAAATRSPCRRADRRSP